MINFESVWFCALPVIIQLHPYYSNFAPSPIKKTIKYPLPYSGAYSYTDIVKHIKTELVVILYANINS